MGVGHSGQDDSMIREFGKEGQGHGLVNSWQYGHPAVGMVVVVCLVVVVMVMVVVLVFMQVCVLVVMVQGQLVIMLMSELAVGMLVVVVVIW